METWLALGLGLGRPFTGVKSNDKWAPPFFLVIYWAFKTNEVQDFQVLDFGVGMILRPNILLTSDIKPARQLAASPHAIHDFNIT